MNKKIKGLILFISIFIFSYIIIADFPTGTVTINEPSHFLNISGNITLQVSIGSLPDGTNVSNVTFQFDNGTGSMQSIGVNTTQNLTIYTFVWDTNSSSIGEGINFTINATATFLNNTNHTDSNLTTTTVENVTVDNTPPTVTANAPADTIFTNGTTITFNASVVDNLFTIIEKCNLTLDPSNATGGAHINSTGNVANGTTVQFINTLPTDVGHTWHIGCTDNNNTNLTGYSTARSLNLGTTPPQVELDLLDSSTRKSKTTFDATDTVIIKCTRSDDDGYNETTMSIQIPTASTFATLETIRESLAVNDSTTWEFKYSKTTRLGDYIAKCEVTDILGNINSSNKTFTVQKKIWKGTSAFANKAFKPPVAKVKISANSVSTLGRLTKEGFSRLMQKNSVIEFNVEGEDHSIKVKVLEKDEVTLTISSTPFDITLKEGETKNIDVNNDGKLDIKATFHKKFGKYADITVNLLTTEEIKKAEEDIVKKAEEKESKPLKASTAGSIIVTIVVIAVIILIGYFLISKKKR